jgi:hypothetical protein
VARDDDSISASASTSPRRRFEPPTHPCPACGPAARSSPTTTGAFVSGDPVATQRLLDDALVVTRRAESRCSACAPAGGMLVNAQLAADAVVTGKTSPCGGRFRRASLSPGRAPRQECSASRSSPSRPPPGSHGPASLLRFTTRHAVRQSGRPQDHDFMLVLEDTLGTRHLLRRPLGLHHPPVDVVARPAGRSI